MTQKEYDQATSIINQIAEIDKHFQDIKKSMGPDAENITLTLETDSVIILNDALDLEPGFLSFSLKDLMLNYLTNVINEKVELEQKFKAL